MRLAGNGFGFRFASVSGLVLWMSLAASCNDHPLVPMDSFVKKTVSDSATIRGKTMFDVLWVVDNSNSMCQEQENLTRNFAAFVHRLSSLDADFKMGVVTTDVREGVDRSGRPLVPGALQHDPAEDLSACIQADYSDDGNYCQTDSDCGIGGCLCGIPHIRLCSSDADCGQGEACVSSAGGATLKYCAATCSGAGDESCAVRAGQNRVFVCAQPPEHQDGYYCLLRTCNTDADCPEDETVQVAGLEHRYEYSCMPHEGEAGVSYCRRKERFPIECEHGGCPLGGECDPVTKTCPAYAVCPAPTCDCPKELGAVLEIKDIGGDEAAQQEASRRFRCMATVGTKGDPTERGLEAIERFIERDSQKPEGQRFLRDEAHLVIVILSDEDDCSGYEQAKQAYMAQYQETRLSQCPEIPETPPDLTLRICDWYKQDLRPVDEFVEEVKALKKDPLKIVVATIVGTEMLECVESCPTPDGHSCIESQYCEDECQDPLFCAERVFGYDVCSGQGEDREHACASTNGIAFSGSRYIRFARAFGDYGMNLSICQESFEGALNALAGLIESVGVRYCLSGGLSNCTSDADCRDSSTMGHAVCRSYWDPTWEAGRGQCISKDGTLLAMRGGCTSDDDCSVMGEGATCDTRAICRWDEDHGGDPADLIISIERADADEPEILDPTTDWDFVPDQDDGCIRFSPEKSPRPKDDVDIRYVSGIGL